MAANTSSVVNGVAARMSIRTSRAFNSPTGFGPRTTTTEEASRCSNSPVSPAESVAWNSALVPTPV